MTGFLFGNNVASATAITSTDSTTAVTLANRFAQVRNVKDFGATGNGSTDDTHAIQITIDQVFADGGGTVFFPPGQYKMTGTSGVNYTDTNTSTKSICFEGVGDASQILSSTVTGFLFDRHRTDMALTVAGIRGFNKLAFKNTYATGGAIMLADSETGFVTNCNIYANQGVWFRSSPTYIAEPNLSLGKVVQNCYFPVIASQTGSNAIVCDCDVNVIGCNIIGYAAAIRAYTNAFNLTVTGCRIEAGNYGVIIGQDVSGGNASAVQVDISQCVFEGDGTAIYLNRYAKVTVKNCSIQVEDGTVPSWPSQPYGIYIGPGSGFGRCVFTNIEVNGNAATAAIYIGDSTSDLHFINCWASNSNGAGGVTWRLPTTMVSPPKFTNCADFPSGVHTAFNPQWTFAQLPASASTHAISDSYFISDGRDNGGGAAVLSQQLKGGGAQVLEATWNGSVWICTKILS